jgi:probable rRNA maturation factor
MKYHVDIQHESSLSPPVSDEILTQWVCLAMTPFRERAEVTLRLVNADEMTGLNFSYRQQNKVTNVLAFPASHPTEIELEYPYIGDVIICPLVLQEESLSLNVPLTAHWAHIVIHGILHLLGYDHMIETDAAIMRPIEIQLLNQLGFENPYQTEDYTLE